MTNAVISRIRSYLTHFFGSLDDRKADLRRQIAAADVERGIGTAEMISGRPMNMATYRYVLHLHQEGRYG